MNHFRFSLLVSSALICAACSTTQAPGPAKPSDPMEACNAFGQTTVGKQLSAEVMAATTKAGLKFRAYHKGIPSPMTMDFNPERVNFVIDDRTIISARCG